jgi:hypothetical protein
MTDSQAIDIVAPWTLDDLGNEIVPMTTFSITIIRYLFGDRLSYFADGLQKLDQMIAGEVSPKSGDNGKWRILIAEACNHTRLNLEKNVLTLEQFNCRIISLQHWERNMWSLSAPLASMSCLTLPDLT